MEEVSKLLLTYGPLGAFAVLEGWVIIKLYRDLKDCEQKRLSDFQALMPLVKDNIKSNETLGRSMSDVVRVVELLQGLVFNFFQKSGRKK